VVSHDRFFLDRICDQIIAFEDDGVRVTPGNYSYYLEKRQARENAAKAQAAEKSREIAARKKATEQKNKPRKLTMAERQELEGIEGKIQEVEVEVEALEVRLVEVQSDFEQLPKVIAELEEARAQRDQRYARWEELEMIQAKSENQ